MLNVNIVLDVFLLMSILEGYQTLNYLLCSYVDDSQCSPVFSTISSSLIECSIACKMNPACKSFFHSGINSTCIGCGQVFGSYDSSSTDADPRYYRPYAFYGEGCHGVEKPCYVENTVCFPGIETCVCDPYFYVLNITSERCIPECPILGSTFQKYPSRYLALTDGWSEGGVTVSQCLQKCASGELSFVCHGTDYVTISSVCFYNSEAVVNSSPYTIMSDAAFDLYIRNCQ